MGIPKREGELKSEFAKELKRQLPGAMMLQYLTPGAPDRSITVGGRTTNWEFKHATPDFESPGNQELCCARLAAAGHCRYVIWYEDGSGSKRTLIVHPKTVLQRTSWDMLSEARCVGFDQRWLVEQVKKAHGIY